MKVGVIVAMEKEMVQLRALLSDVSDHEGGRQRVVSGTIGQNEVFMQQCGMGKVNSAVGCTTLIHDYHPDIVISTGVAGGASTELEVTDVVVGTDYVYHDVYCGKEVEYGRMVGMPPRFVADDTLLAKARALQTETRIHTGRIVSGDWFVDSKEKMRSILHHFPDAMAVDMESASIAQTCFLHGVPFVSFRIISDIPLKDTDAAQYWDFWQRIANGSFEVTRQYLEML